MRPSYAKALARLSGLLAHAVVVEVEVDALGVVGAKAVEFGLVHRRHCEGPRIAGRRMPRAGVPPQTGGQPTKTWFKRRHTCMEAPGNL